MSSDDEDGGNYVCGYDCDVCGYDDGEEEYDDEQEVIRTVKDDVYDEDDEFDEFEILKTSVQNLQLQISALVKKLSVLEMKVEQLEGNTTSQDHYDDDQYPDDEYIYEGHMDDPDPDQ